MPDSDSGAKDRTAVLDAHAKLAYDSWNKRREYEWKLTIGFWSVLVLPVGFTVREVRVDPMGYSIVALAAFALYLNWLRGIWCANEFDRQQPFHFSSSPGRSLPNGKLL
jgi:hypothetical protein